MERPLITLTVFVSAILLGYSPLLVESLGPENSRSDQSAPPADTSSSSSSSSRPPPPRQAPTRETGENHHSHSPPPLQKTRNSHSHRRPRGRRHPRRRNGKKTPMKANVGKKIGLLFVVIAGSLQVGVVLFLGIKRWQIMKLERHSS